VATASTRRRASSSSACGAASKPESARPPARRPGAFVSDVGGDLLRSRARPRANICS
jgi:hypothetical protein